MRVIAILLTVLTGFSGLVYEVSWQKYLAILLGSHSEATAAVLGIFLFGLSLGYTLFGGLTRRLVARGRARGTPPRLLIVYAAVEAAIGAYALAFPTLFGAVQGLSLQLHHGVSGWGFAVDVGLTALLLLPPTVLMGGTIPMLTQALSRNLADATRFHALVYGFNTAGAFAGALAAGFILIPELGLVKVLFAMGALNIGVGALFALLGRNWRQSLDSVAASDTAVPTSRHRPFLWVALLSGAAMMAVQTVLIRVAGSAFGASHFTFATLVAVFVLSIALGSLAVSALRRVPRSTLLVDLAGVAILLSLLYTRLDEAPYWVYRLRILFPSDDASFYPFHISGFVAVLALIGLPVALSGATLPLIFHQLRRDAADLGAVAGSVYSWNTVGSLLGAVGGGYAALFWVDLDDVFRLALAALWLAFGIVALKTLAGSRRAVAALLIVPILGGGLLVWSDWDPALSTASLFRRRTPVSVLEGGVEAVRARINDATDLVFFEDDPISSVAVREHPIPSAPFVSRNILNNGKSDGETLRDYPTMALMGLIPALFADPLESAFVIGFGTGVTAGELLALSSMREVTVAEISPGVMRAAPLFDFANRGMSGNPKLRVIQSDAYRALVRSSQRYDIIASEPSNPWMTGVEMLFSAEFLRAARDRLSQGGVYAQWYHRYESDTATLALVLRTYASVFDSVAVWYALGNDLLLLGMRAPQADFGFERVRQAVLRPDLAAGLLRAGIGSLPALLAHELLPLGTLRAAQLRGSIHTLFHPLLSHQAGRAFFRGAQAALPFTGYGDAARAGARASLLEAYRRSLGGRLPDPQRVRLVREACRYQIGQCVALLARWKREKPGSPTLAAELDRASSKGAFAGRVDPHAVLRMSRFAEEGAETSVSRARALGDLQRETLEFEAFYYHGAPFAGRSLLADWERCEEDGRFSEACRAGRDAARALLARGR